MKHIIEITRKSKTKVTNFSILISFYFLPCGGEVKSSHRVRENSEGEKHILVIDM